MAEMVYFKVYVDYGQEMKPEVRRFGLDKVNAMSFERVSNKVREMIPSLRKCKSADIGWKDDDDDFVSISSDEELQIAISMSPDDTKRLYVVVDNDKSGESDLEQPEIEIVAGFLESPNDSSGNADGPMHHSGVVCDGCENPVVGFRYKCMSCADYDLCVQCEWAGMHSQHVMLRIPKPINTAFLHHHHGSRLVHHLLKSLKKQNYAGYTKEQKLQSHELGSAKKSKERKDRKEHGKQYRGKKANWMDTVASCLEDVAKDMAERNGVGKAQCSDATVGTDKESGDASKNDPKSHHDVDANFAEIHKQYLNSIQNMASKILEPLCTVGMEVFKQYGSQPMPNSAARSEAGSSTDPASHVPAKETAEAPFEEAAECQQTSNAESDAVEASSLASEEQASDKASSMTSERVEEWTLINDPSDKELQLPTSGGTNESEAGENANRVTVSPSAPPPASSHLKNSFGLPVQTGPYHNLMRQVMEDLNTNKSEEFHQMEQKAQANAAIPLGFKSTVTNQSELPPPLPVNFYGERPVSAAPHSTRAGPKLPSQPISHSSAPPAQLPAVPPPRLHPKPHIDSALQHMLAMGFCNEGGWLTQLLESKDGNISAVLDLLSPAKKSN